MLHIQSFTFNPFQENTYILFNEEKKAIIIDPGMLDAVEENSFFNFITANQLEPILLLNTHTHLDHIFGNAAVLKKYTIPFAFHLLDRPVFDSAAAVSAMYHVPMQTSPEPSYYLENTGKIKLGADELSILFTPGHSPGSVSFYHEAQKILISGDVLFQMSIGRTDLPGGDFDTLANSIHTQLFSLPDDTKVYSGHGPMTTIGFEKMNNPFVGSRK